MMSEEEVRDEMNALLVDIEESANEPDLQSYLNTVLGVLQWVVGDMSMDEVLSGIEEASSAQHKPKV